MALGGRCRSGNTCGCMMSWTYRWAVMVRRINTRGDRVLHAMPPPHAIMPAVGEACHCKAKAGLRRSPRGLRTNTIVITAEIESGFVAKYDLVPFRCRPVSSCTVPLQTEVSMGGHQRQHT
ncbi:uncharacterized protein TNCV_606071 [Trichonephila clavipes]|nr:uncharacterized protein TNCV_606071 [Trichonephila clavipes]